METKGLPKVLIIEDEDSILNMYKFKLEKEWFEVNGVRNGENIVRIIEAFHPDILLIDIMMPVVNGFQALEKINAHISYPVKKIIFSNLSRPADFEKAKELWADDYYIKSNLMPKELVNRLKILLKD